MKTNNKKNSLLTIFILIGVFVLVFVLEQILPANAMLFTVLQKGVIYALVAVSMNLLNGFTGLFSLGQAGFMLIGAYCYGIFTIPVLERASVYQYFDGGIIKFALPVPIALILAGLAAAVFAALIGIPVLRLKSDYLAIATLGFAEIIRAIFQWDKLGPVTNGSNLLRKFPSFNDFNITDANGAVIIRMSTLVPFIIVGICVLIIVLLINSSYGRAFKAIRDDEVAAEAMGINLFKHKEMSFVISSFFAGVGGALLAMYQMTIQASAFKSNMTYEILLVVVIGGIGSVTGSCIGSFLFIACSEWWLRGLDSGTFLGINAPVIFRSGFRKVVFAVIIMAIVLFYRKGLMGENEFSAYGIRNFFLRIFNKKKGEAKK
ncbi:MAG: branched-chain amino acid ABC transporter permease [Lachnospiraceae bacterium]|jgi:branched-chain amino acid transport system permease protein|nr:branched-chain amino acid ABC transporter permease [Lachnospiraceae bacterium]